MIKLLFVWLFINSIHPATQPEPLYGVFKSEPREQLKWLGENKKDYFICSFDFKKADKGNKHVENAKKAVFEMIKEKP